jgi:hypothetical protein
MEQTSRGFKLQLRTRLRKTKNVGKKPNKEKELILKRKWRRLGKWLNSKVGKKNLREVRKRSFGYLENTFSLDAKISTSYMSN